MILNQFYIATLLLLFSNFNLLFYKIIKIKKNNLYIKNGIYENIYINININNFFFLRFEAFFEIKI